MSLRGREREIEVKKGSLLEITIEADRYETILRGFKALKEFLPLFRK